jgi:hypothetical protein
MDQKPKWHNNFSFKDIINEALLEKIVSVARMFHKER